MSFSSDVSNFIQNHRALCTATLGFAIPVYCLVNLFGRLVCWISSPEGTVKKVDDVAKPMPQPPKSIDPKPLPKITKDVETPPLPVQPQLLSKPENNPSPFSPSSQTFADPFIPLIAKAKTDLISNLTSFEAELNEEEKKWAEIQEIDPQTRIDKIIKKYENEPAFKDDPAYLKKLAKMQAEGEVYKEKLIHDMQLSKINALLHSCYTHSSIYLKKEEIAEIIQPFLAKYDHLLEEDTKKMFE